MGSFNVSDFVHQADQQDARYTEQLNRFASLIAETEQHRMELQGRGRVAAADLMAALLPEDSESAYQVVADRFHAPELLRIYRTGQQQAAALRDRIAAIERDPRFANRDLNRLHAQQHLEEVEPLYDVAHRDLLLLKSMPGLMDLVERGYGTESYPYKGWGRFLHTGYLHDWRRSDEIVSELGEADFAAVIARVRDRVEQENVLGRSIRDEKTTLSQVAALEAEHDRVSKQLDNLPKSVRTSAGQALAGLLVANAGMLDTAPDVEALRGRIRMMDGIDHQIKYLDSIKEKAAQDQAQLTERAEKLRAERERYASDPHRYRNKLFTDQQFARRFSTDSRYDRAYDRYARASNTVYVYNDYDRVTAWDVASEFLWWDVFTGGAMNGGFIPEVQSYYAANPNYAYTRSDDPSDYGQSAGSGGYSGDGS